MWQLRSLCLSLMVLAPLAAGTQVKVNPVETVIELLQKIRDQIMEEGKDEAVGYDKFACFCKDQANEKQVVIKKSEEKISVLNSQIDLLASEIEELDSAVADDRKEREKLTKEGDTADEKRAKQFDEYSGEEKDMSKAIKAIEGAIEALETSRGAVNSGASLLAAKNALQQVADSGKHTVASTTVRQLVALLGEDPAAYEYASNDIIATLQGLLKTFKKDKVELDTEEAGHRQSYEMEKGARDFQIKTLGELIEQNTAMSAEKTEKKSETEATLEEETNMKTKDQEFLKELTSLCEEKAEGWDKRSKMRASEITAITEALGDLSKGVAENYSANKKLTLLVEKHPLVSSSEFERPALQARHGLLVEDNGEQLQQEGNSDADEDELDELEGVDDVSFLQLRGKQAPKHALRKAKQAAVHYLLDKANSLKSKRLSAIAAKLELGKDHFVKVRGIIKDLIAKLEADAEAEATQKGYCDEEMGKATKKA